MTELTPELLAELRRLERQATPGEWRHFWHQALDQIYGPDDRLVVSDARHPDAALITAMRNALPFLLDAAERGLKAEAMIRRDHALCNETVRNLRLLSNECREDVADAIHAAARPLCYIGADQEDGDV